MQYFNAWEFIAGLGIFLFGMHLMEEAIRQLVGRRFKLFLLRHSQNKIKGILSGAGITAVLQSSSVVSLIVLAFVGAGVIPMRHAIAIVMGSNLGTTATGWLVAMVGFKVDIESLAFPLIGVGALIMIMMDSKYQWPAIGKGLLGLGLLFLGLGFMKTSVGQLAEQFDLTPYVAYPPIVFLLIGLILTAIIQSSSAAMVITLSALHSDIIPLDSAAAMIIGADLGTTVTVLLGGMTGVPAKKRVAMAHFLFNLVTDILAFLALPWLLKLTQVLSIGDPLFALVLIHSTFNAAGIILFYPFIGALSKFLERQFTDLTIREAQYIHELTPEVPEAALKALSKEIDHLFEKVMDLMKANFEDEQVFGQPSFKQQYRAIKQLEGEMFEFYTQLQQQKLEPEEADRLNQLINTIRHFLHATKGAKDVHEDLMEMSAAADRVIHELYHDFRESGWSFFETLKNIMREPQSPTCFEDLAELLQVNQKIYQDLLRKIYQELSKKQLSQVEISTILNVNRELYSSRNALVMAVKDFLLEAKEAMDFQNLPAPLMA